MDKPVNQPDIGKIYDQHDAAFAHVSAFVILDKAREKVATIAFKFPPKGHGERRVYAYVHWFGLPMVRGWASGGGYDKKTAAVASAIARMGSVGTKNPDGHWSVSHTVCENFKITLAYDSGPTWQSCLEATGFIVLQAV